MKYIPRLLKKIVPSTKINSKIDKTAKVENGSYLLNSFFGRYSYCGHNCQILNTNIGSFCSIASNVRIGLGKHPLNWVSTSPAFYKGRDSISKRLAKLEYNGCVETTIIENDVWIGEGAIILSGVKVANGAVIGAGSVVTKDIGPYEVFAGAPARFIKKRFDDRIIQKILKTEWWLMSDEQLKSITNTFNDVDLFLKTILL